MMSQSKPSIVLMAALLLSNLSCCSADNVYCVIPTLPGSASCSSCPNNSMHCATLSEYAKETELYFTSNTTMVFMPGDHTLDMNITAANIVRLNLHGETSSGYVVKVVCNGSVGFNFTNMTDFKAKSLTFTSCGRNYGSSQFKATLLLESTKNTELVNCSFHGNIGTALTVRDTNITLAENTEFTHNHCDHEGLIPNSACIGRGGITAFDSNLIFTGNITFNGNTVSKVIKLTNCSLTSTGSIHFLNNSYPGDSSVAIWVSTSSLNFNGTSNFINNFITLSADCTYWGAIFAFSKSSLRFSGTSNFINNSAHCYGDAILVAEHTCVSFTGTGNFINNVGRAIYAFRNSSVSFDGSSNFINNSGSNGGAIVAYDTYLNFSGTSNFINNSADYVGGAICAEDNTLLSVSGTINFINNTAPNGNGGGIYLSTSSFSILPNTTLFWQNNHAKLGGAIYVDDHSNPFTSCTRVEPKCFFQLPGQNLSISIDVQFVFVDNSADAAGSVLYGGAIDNCTLTGLHSYSSGNVFDMLFHIENNSRNSSISSDPFHICLCKGNIPSCSRSVRYTVYPGETFHVSLIAFGQRNGITPSTVRSRFNHLAAGFLQGFQYTQETKSTCTKLSYTVFSIYKYQYNVHLELYADGPCTPFSNELVLQLDLNETCPPGFNLSKRESSCICEGRLLKYTIHCNITDGLGRITRDSHDQFWVGYDPSHGLILHPHCPLDYCVSCTVELPLNNTDLQCVNHRSGLLCGACKKGYSLVLGTSQCEQCTNNHLVLLVPFALMGIALVFFLLVCKLTVATGTLSGVVFYANIVGVNRTLFLPVETTNALSAFIAWLNLDFGVESCFYNGMDAYSKTWLQFVFPLYIWLIVGLLILVSHFSDKFPKLLGNNPVSVLATLILLSYAKILRTIIAAINVTYLEYPMYSKAVWLCDANIDYLRGKHIPLFLVAMFFFLFLFLPYTLLLFFGQWLLAVSRLRLFTWVNKLKPFMDSYHAPYKPKHRYWPGLLLVLRFGLLLIFAVNPQQDPSINLLAILVGTGVLTIWAWISGEVYRKMCLNALEGSFILNLMILAAATYHVKLSGRNQLAVGYTSVIIALVTFLGILAYHIFQQVRATNLWKVLKMDQRFKKLKLNPAPVNDAEEDENSSCELRESLLEDPPQQPNYGTL